MTHWNPIALARRLARNSPWVLIAAAIHLIVLAGAAIFYTAAREPKTGDEAITIDTRRRETPIEVPPELPAPIVRRPVDMAKEIEMVPMPEDWTPTDVEPTSEPHGDPLSDAAITTRDPGGSAIGPGKIGRAGLHPGPFGPRLGQRVRGEIGGGEQGQTEIAVLHGLAWLARHQNPDGSWGLESSRARCTAAEPCFDPAARYTANYDEGLTALALLGFLGAGHSTESRAWFTDPVTHERVLPREVVKRGLQWLVQHQNEDGSFARGRPFLYTEALATMALCEAYGLTQQRYFREPAQRALDFLQAAQRPNPSGRGAWGWRYAARQEIERFHQGDTLDERFRKELYDADTSVTGWCVMALKSGRLAGLDVRQESLDGGLAFCQWVTADDGRVGYLDPKGAGATVTGPGDHFVYHPAAMSALAVCIRAFTAHDFEDPALEPAARRVAADLPRVSKDRLSIDYYYWYYGSLALNQFDGPDSPRKNGKLWTSWNKAMVAAVTDLQEGDPKSCHHGAWLVPDRWSHAGGPLYATAINVLTLEVYYRYPNAFGAKAVERPPAPQGVK